jgi:hypothetical protein
VILIDANILLYAYVPSSKYHEPARAWLETTFSKPDPVGLSWATILAFLRISTTTRVLEHPFSAAEAAGIVSGWLESPFVTIPIPGEPHWQILRELITKGQAHGPLITDAHLAALAIEHGATLATTDRDFTRFPGLRILNPLA